MDAKSKAYEEMCQQVADWSDRHGFSLGATAELGNLLEKFHLTQCQEVERLNNLIMYGSNFVESTVRNNALEDAIREAKAWMERDGRGNMDCLIDMLTALKDKQ